MITPERMAEIKARCEAATAGPMLVDGSHIYTADKKILAVVHNPGSKTQDYPLAANRDLMANAFSDIPDLVQALEEAEGRIKKLQDDLREAERELQRPPPLKDYGMNPDYEEGY